MPAPRESGASAPAGHEIAKAGAIIIRNGRLLVVRSHGKDTFVAPGGKLEAGETPEQALVRELKEELGVITRPDSFRPFAVFQAPAATDPGRVVTMHVFTVDIEASNFTPQAEIAELAWLGKHIPAGMKVGSIFEHEVLPRLVQEGLVR